MEITTNAKIRVRLESFNHELLVSSCRKIIETLNSASLNSISMVTLPTSKRVYCILRSPHVNKDSREQFEIRTHKRVLEIYYNSDMPIVDLLTKIELSPGIVSRVYLS
jgi:small subunit ribosomal protein S10